MEIIIKPKYASAFIKKLYEVVADSAVNIEEINRWSHTNPNTKKVTSSAEIYYKSGMVISLIQDSLIKLFDGNDQYSISVEYVQNFSLIKNVVEGIVETYENNKIEKFLNLK